MYGVWRYVICYGNCAWNWLCIVYRENEQLSKYGDTKSARAIMLVELKKLIEANPLFRDKLQFPNLKNSRLRTLINQRYNVESKFLFMVFGEVPLWTKELRHYSVGLPCLLKYEFAIQYKCWNCSRRTDLYFDTTPSWAHYVAAILRL